MVNLANSKSNFANLETHAIGSVLILYMCQARVGSVLAYMEVYRCIRDLLSHRLDFRPEYFYLLHIGLFLGDLTEIKI